MLTNMLHPRNLLPAIVASACAACSSTPQRVTPPLWPEPLQRGDTIMFVAPAGELDEARMNLARERLEARGYRVVQRPDLFAKEGYLAGNDRRRADELMQAFLDPEVDAIFPGTGGYGTMRMLDLLDYEVIRKNPKTVIGFSDVTALHAALNRRTGLVTFHSPNPMYGLGSEDDATPFTSEWFFHALECPRGAYTIDVPDHDGRDTIPQPVALARGKARGRLVGGNLSLISALEGTPYAIDTRDAILLIEDTREAPYRVDRAVLGQFTRNYDREDETRGGDPRFSVDGVLRQYFEDLGVPVLMNYPVGHHAMNATLPLGGEVEIDADAGTLTVVAP